MENLNDYELKSFQYKKRNTLKIIEESEDGINNLFHKDLHPIYTDTKVEQENGLIKRESTPLFI